MLDGCVVIKMVKYARSPTLQCQQYCFENKFENKCLASNVVLTISAISAMLF